MKRLDSKRVALLVTFVLVLGALAAWGQYLHMSAGALRWIEAAAGAVGAIVMALLPSIFADKDGDGIPDIVERTTTTTAVVTETTTEKK